MTAAPSTLSAPVPPQNLEAEESVLGAMLISATAIGSVTEILDAADFYRESHAKIYRAALGLWAKGEPVDAITLADELKELLVVVGESRPGACHTGADTLVSLAKRVRAIIPDEIGPVEVRDTIEAALVPDDLRQFLHERFVPLDWVGVPRRCARRQGGTAGKGKREGEEQDGQNGAHRCYLPDSGATPARRGEVARAHHIYHPAMPTTVQRQPRSLAGVGWMSVRRARHLPCPAADPRPSSRERALDPTGNAGT